MKILRLLLPVLVGVLTFELITLHRKLDHQSAQIERLLVPRAATETVVSATNAPLDSAQWHTLADVKEWAKNLDENASTQNIAAAIAEVDEWLFEPKSAAAVQKILVQHFEWLRKRVLYDVQQLHEVALAAKTGAEAAKSYNEAGRLMALFPMSESPAIVEQARSLTTAHRNVGLKLEVAKRVRYNRWAVDQLEKAIQGYHEKSSLWSPKKENPLLMDMLVATLSEVDPNQLEPTILSLYNYAVDLTKDSISEADKVSLAKRMTAPDIRRKLPDDF